MSFSYSYCFTLVLYSFPTRRSSDLFLAAPEQEKKDLEDTHIYRISKEDDNIVVIDSFLIIEHLNRWYEHLEFQLVGPTQTIIRISKNKKATPVLFVSFVWLLLFVGAAMTIMNFI